MLKPLTALILAGVIAVTSTAPSPARAANPDDIAKLIIGGLVIYGISEAVKDNRRSHKSNVRGFAPPVTKRSAVVRPVKKRLPKGCVVNHRQRFGEKRSVFGNQCLRNNYRGYARLPDRCFRRFQTVRGTRVGWGPRCLRRAGYTW